MVYEGLKGEGIGDDDIFMLSRSFFIGGARYGAGAWSGDIQSSFDEFHRQVRIGQNVAMSGIHWWTTDIGGYTGGNANDPEFQQLLIPGLESCGKNIVSEGTSRASLPYLAAHAA